MFIDEKSITQTQNVIERAPAHFAENGVPPCTVSACL